MGTLLLRCPAPSLRLVKLAAYREVICWPAACLCPAFPFACALTPSFYRCNCCRYEFIASEGSPEAAASGVNQAAAAAPAAPAPAATPKRKAPSGAAAADGGPTSGGPASKRSRAAAALASGGAAVPATVAAAGVGVSTPGNGGAAGAVDVDAMFKLNQANQVWGSWRGVMFCMPLRQHGLFCGVDVQPSWCCDAPLCCAPI